MNAAPSVPPSEAEGLYRLGWDREQDGREPAKAVAAYRASAAIAAPTLAVDALFRAGFVAQRAEMRSIAIESYRHCLALAEKHAVGGEAVVHATYWLGFHLEAEGRYLDAIERYREVRGEPGLIGLEAAYRGLLCLAAIGRLAQALEWSDDFTLAARQARRQGHDPEALIAAIERERAELALILQTEGGP